MAAVDLIRADAALERGMIDWWREWKWTQYERRASVSEDFAEFEKVFSGPITPDLAAKMPLSILLKRRSGEVGHETRAIVDAEIGRRLNSTQPMIANVISVIALVVSVIALVRAS